MANVNYAEVAAEDLSATSAVDVAAFVTEAINLIIDSEQVPSGIQYGFEAIKAALETADGESES